MLANSFQLRTTGDTSNLLPAQCQETGNRSAYAAGPDYQIIFFFFHTKTI